MQFTSSLTNIKAKYYVMLEKTSRNMHQLSSDNNNI